MCIKSGDYFLLSLGAESFLTLKSSVADPDPKTHIFESLVTIFWFKSSIIL